MSEKKKFMCQCGSTKDFSIGAIAVDRVTFYIDVFVDGEFDVVCTGKEECEATIYNKYVKCLGCDRKYSIPGLKEIS